MSSGGPPRKRNFKIELFKHRVELDPKYTERTWKVLEHAIHEIYNHNASGLSFEELYRHGLMIANFRLKERWQRILFIHASIKDFQKSSSVPPMAPSSPTPPAPPDPPLAPPLPPPSETAWARALRKLLPAGAPLPDEEQLDYSSVDLADSAGERPLFRSSADGPPLLPLARHRRRISRLLRPSPPRRRHPPPPPPPERAPSPPSSSDANTSPASSPPRCSSSSPPPPPLLPPPAAASNPGGKRRGACARCGKGGIGMGILREREECLACGARYCAGCVLRAMGSMPEGRKCVGCIGRPVPETRRRARLGKGLGLSSSPRLSTSPLNGGAASELDGVSAVRAAAEGTEKRQLQAGAIYASFFYMGASVVLMCAFLSGLAIQVRIELFAVGAVLWIAAAHLSWSDARER
ncbi:hypothetical protein E2562_004653 [Oryza meyeriana var. granulata]|uniref:Uncharacterized protein n=1 Tax=Oryza meyeriana var. granulata TaxID=110450 RepID=A0A6G1DE36_9ORYZ|nr:hypothetical protein E2562_004653 [Oryza meyeriana var. granulata]